MDAAKVVTRVALGIQQTFDALKRLRSPSHSLMAHSLRSHSLLFLVFGLVWHDLISKIYVKALLCPPTRRERK